MAYQNHSLPFTVSTLKDDVNPFEERRPKFENVIKTRKSDEVKKPEPIVAKNRPQLDRSKTNEEINKVVLISKKPVRSMS